MIAVRGFLRVVLVSSIVLLLVGCMQALQTGQGTTTPTLSLSSTTTRLSGTVEKGTPMTVKQTTNLSATQVVQVSSITPTQYPSATRTSSVPMEGEATLSPMVTVTPSPTRIRVTQPTTPTATPTPSPTATPTPSPTATPTPIVTIVLPTLPTLTNEQRWRNQQEERTPFATLRSYSTSNSTLWWYDPVNQQHVSLGSFSGTFDAQATFILAKTQEPALEVPYQVNQSYGITALSPALLKRIEGAGYGEWIETYVISSPQVTPQ